MPGRILAMGGYSPRFDDAVLELGGRRVCLVPTANPDPERLVRLYASSARRAEPSHVSFDPWPRADREHVLSRDVIYAAGGNTANALAIWRAHGFDAVLREAWEQDILLAAGRGDDLLVRGGRHRFVRAAARGDARRARLSSRKRVPAL